MLKTRQNQWLLALILLILAATIVVAVVGSRRDPAEEAAITPPVEIQATPQVVIKEVEKLVEVEKKITAEAVQDGLRDMGFLVTEEYYFTEVVSFSSLKKFLNLDLKITESSYLASYDGVVYAGVDFTKARVHKDEAAGKITVTLPKAEVQTVSIDPESFVLYSEKHGLGNPLSMKDYNSSLVTLEDTAESKAVERGMLDRAEENAQALVTRFVAGLVDLSRYTVNVEIA